LRSCGPLLRRSRPDSGRRKSRPGLGPGYPVHIRSRATPTLADGIRYLHRDCVIGRSSIRIRRMAPGKATVSSFSSSSLSKIAVEDGYATGNIWRSLTKRAEPTIAAKQTADLYKGIPTPAKETYGKLYRRHLSATPLSLCAPLSSSLMPDSTTRFLTVAETSTSFAPALAITRAPI